jgi:hypothetical protein
VESDVAFAVVVARCVAPRSCRLRCGAAAGAADGVLLELLGAIARVGPPEAVLPNGYGTVNAAANLGSPRWW